MQRNVSNPARSSNIFAGFGSQLVFRERHSSAALGVISALMLLYPQYAGAVDIDDAITEPVQTSTIDDGAPGDITLTEDGSITFEDVSDASAVTVDSSNNISIEGEIDFNDTVDVLGDADNTTAIRIQSGFTGDVFVSGSLSLSEDYVREDEDGDDDEDGPLAMGANRYGLYLEDGGAHTGHVRFDYASSIFIEGNDSIGVYLGSSLDGNLELESSISVKGDNAQGVVIEDGVTGNVLIGDAVSATGEGATAVSVTGDIGGGMVIESTITGTGFTSTSATNYVAPANVDEDTDPLEDRLDEDDLYDNGPTVAIGSSIDGGLLISGYIDEVEDDDDDDEEIEDKDEVDDFNENRGTGSIYSYGSAPALLITPDWGDADSDLVLGAITETIRDTLDDDDDDDYWETLTINADGETLAEFANEDGFINRGSIYADGQNVGFDALAVSISGSSDGLYNTIIEGSILNEGRMDARAFEANATAVSLGSGLLFRSYDENNVASDGMGAFNNDGTIYAQVNYEVPLTDDGDVDTDALEDMSAIGLLIGEGAQINAIANDGVISSAIVSDDADAVAIRDLSGNVSLIENTGTISAIAYDDDSDNADEDDTHPEFTGSTIAIDMSSHSADQGVELRQELYYTSSRITGDILFGAGDDTINLLAGTIDGDTDFGTGSATLNIADAFYYGDIVFGGDDAAISLDGGYFQGDIYFGSATSTLSITNGSTFDGGLVSETAAIEMILADSTLSLSDGNATTLQSLSISGESELGFEIRTNSSEIDPYITVIGDASISSDVVIHPIVTGVVDEDYSRVIIEAGDLDIENVDLLINEEDLSWIYKVSLSEETGDTDQLVMNFSMKSGDEIGLDDNQDSAFAAILEVAADNDDFGEELLSITNQNDFMKAYNLLLPQRTDASTRYLESQTNAAFSALSERLALRRTKTSLSSGFWTQEHLTHINVKPDTNQPGYEGRGFGVSFGYDRSLGLLDAVGVMVSVTDGRFEEATGGVTPVSTTSYGFSGFLSESFGPIDLQLAGQYGIVSFASTRNVSVGEYESEIKGEWDGASQAYSAVISTDLNMGAFSMRPKVAYDYFTLDQDGYTETSDEGLHLTISDATTERSTISGGVSFGYSWNRKQRDQYAEIARTRTNALASGKIEWLAQLDLGYRDTVSSAPYEVTAQYVGYEETFQLLSPELFGEAATTGVSITGIGDLFSARLGVDAELSDEAEIYTGNISVRFRF